MWLDVDIAVTVPVNIAQLINDTDFKTIDETIVYDESGMDLNWNFLSTDGTITQTNVTPTTGDVYDWYHSGNGMYKIEIPASGGGSINNNIEGFGWFSGIADAILPFVGPVIGFRAAALNNALIDGGDNLDVNITQYSGTNVGAPDTAGYPKVTIKDGTGVGEIALTSGKIDEVAALTNHTAQSGDSFARLGAPDGASIAADLVTINNLVDELESRLTAARAGYLDELAAANLPADVDTLLSRLSAARAGYIDLLNDAIAEPGVAQPQQTPTFIQLLGWLWADFRNENTANRSTGKRTIKNDAGTTLAQASITDDNTEAKKQKFVSG